MHRIFQDATGLYSRAFAIPHRAIAEVSFLCRSVPSWLSCASCASMFNFRLSHPQSTPPSIVYWCSFVSIGGSPFSFVVIVSCLRDPVREPPANQPNQRKSALPERENQRGITLLTHRTEAGNSSFIIHHSYYGPRTGPLPSTALPGLPCNKGPAPPATGSPGPRPGNPRQIPPPGWLRAFR